MLHPTLVPVPVKQSEINSNTTSLIVTDDNQHKSEWLRPVIYAVFLVLILYLRRKSNARTGYQLPPGPNIIQFIRLAFPWTNRRNTIQDWKEKYGKIFGIYTNRGNNNHHVFINDYELLKKTFAMDASTGRPPNISQTMNAMAVRNRGEISGGVIFSVGKLWTAQRKITLNYIGRQSNYTGQIFADARKLVECLNSRIDAQQTDFGGSELFELMGVRMINIIQHVLTGRDADEPKSKLFYKLSRSLLINKITTNFLLFLPWLRHVPFFSKCFDCVRRGPAFVREIQHQAVTAHQQGRTDSSFMEHYMTSMKKLYPRGSSELTERNMYQNMERTMAELYATGSESTTTSMSFMVLYMAKFPRVLERVRKEVDDAWTDDDDLQYLLASMPYSRATILELLRHIPSLYVTMHTLTSDAEIEGFRLPAKTVIAANLYGINHDQKYWKDPENFRPERFIKIIDGKPTFVKNERVVTFSIGKRRCPGDRMAMDVMFLFLIHIVKNFNIKAPEGEELGISPIVGLVHRCPPFRCTLSRR